MAEVNVRPEVIPEGTAVDVYAADHEAERAQRRGELPGTEPVASGTVTDGSVEIDLNPGSYWVVAEVGGQVRFVRFEARP